MAITIELPAHTREARGHHNKALRRQGKVPAILYGHNVEPRSLETDARVLHRVWMTAGRTHLVDLKVDGGRAQKVLVRDIQVDPRSGAPLHADLYAVNLREKLTADVPVVIVGEAPAVVDLKIGTLQQLVTTLRIESLPGDIPAQFSVDVSGLDEVDAGVRVGEIPVPDGVTILHTDPEELVVKVTALRVVEAEEEAAAEAPAEEAAAAPDEEAPAE